MKWEREILGALGRIATPATSRDIANAVRRTILTTPPAMATIANVVNHLVAEGKVRRVRRVPTADSGPIDMRTRFVYTLPDEKFAQPVDAVVPLGSFRVTCGLWLGHPFYLTHTLGFTRFEKFARTYTTRAEAQSDIDEFDPVVRNGLQIEEIPMIQAHAVNE